MPPATAAPAPALKRRDRVLLALVSALMRLPFGMRVSLAGWLGRWVAGPISSMRPRTAAAVRHFLPDLPEARVNRIAAAVPGNFFRLVIEILSGPDLARQAAGLPLSGPGLAALDEAHAQGRPAILVTAHFGNYDAARLALIARGFRLGGYFKEMGHPAINDLYLKSATASGAPMFPDTGEGLRGVVRFLRGGGMLGILIDLDRPQGVMLDFLGQPTRTVLSLAEMALKYNAVLVPIWGIRTRDEHGFRVQIDAPVPHTDARTMTQTLNDAFAAQVRQHPEQWVWWHNRRKATHPAPAPRDTPLDRPGSGR